MTGIDVLGLKDSNQIPYQASHAHPYASSLSSSASSSSSSVFSLDGLSTQSSISSTSTNPVDVIWENDGDAQGAARGPVPAGPPRGAFRAKHVDAPVAPELRRHPRRTNSGPVQANGVPCARPPPALLRQSERKVNFVDNLVDSASQIVETIWPLSAAAHRSDAATGCKGVLPLRTFIQETLRRSRTSYSTLQVALYYLIKIKSHVPSPDASPDQNGGKPVCRAMQCGRRMFLAALILASKYLQDRNYSARAWSKISGLNTAEINQNELMFLGAVSWRLHIPEALFQRWTDIVLKLTQGGLAVGGLTWRSVIPRLTPELDGEVEASPLPGPLTPTSMRSYDARFSESPSPRGSSTRGGPCVAPPPSEPCSLPSIHESLGLCRRTSPVGLGALPRLDGSQGVPPSMPRPPMLPTPQLTPQAAVASTPAVGAGGLSSHRRHICSAMSQAHHAGLARSTLDQRPPPSMCARASTFDGYPTVRRSSLARSSSSASSPDSMVSDVSTLSSSSRSSSVSSSSASGPGAVSLPRLATLRCTNNSLKDGRRALSIASPIDEGVFSDFYNSPDLYGAPLSHAPDFSRFSLGTPVDLSSAHEAAQGLCELSGAVSRPTPAGASQRPCRKRGRAGSDDLPLPTYVSGSQENTPVLPSGPVMNRFLNSKTLSAAQLRALGHTSLSGPVGTKRARCGDESQKLALHPSMRVQF